jgi:hypothetical protein
MNYIVENPEKFKENSDFVNINQVKALHDSGLVILPLRAVGDKSPRNSYPRDANGDYKKDADGIFVGYSWEYLEHDFSHNESGIGVLCGKDGLEILDIENTELYQDFRDEFHDELIIEELPVVSTPKPGYHVYWRCSVNPSQKLAMSEDGKNVLIETRGKGNYGIAPGSSINCHKLKKPYLLVQGDLTDIPDIEEDLRARIIAWARSKNEYVKTIPEIKVDFEKSSENTDPNLPSNIFASRVSWEKLLGAWGWRLESHSGGVQSWTRPGKDGGISATVGYQGRDRLHVFTSSVPALEMGREYSKAQFLCRCQFAGDWGATVAYLVDQYSPSPLPLNPPTYEWEETPDETDEFIAATLKQVEAKAKEKNWLSLEELKSRPSPEYLVKGHINKKTVNIFYGPSNHFKSFYALDMALCIATGTPFMGHKVKQEPVAYIYSEGAEAAKVRILSWFKAKKIPLPKDMVFTFPCTFDLNDDDSIEELISEIKHLPVKVGAIWIDTLNRNCKADENSTADMTLSFDRAAKIKDQLGITVNIIHHTGKDKDKGGRGSNVFRSNCDTEFLIEKFGNQVAAKTQKQKDIAFLSPYLMDVKVVDSDFTNEDNEVITTCVLEYAGTMSAAKDFDFKSEFKPVARHLDTEDWVSTAQLIKLTGLSDNVLYPLLKQAKEKNWLEYVPNKGPKPALYRFTETGNCEFLTV